MKLKKKTKKKIFRFILGFVVFILVACVLGLSIFAYVTIPKLNRIETYKPDDKFFWADYFYLNGKLKIKDGIKGVLVSDDISEFEQSATMLKAISEKQSPEYVFLISEIENLSALSDIYVCKKCKFYGVDGRIDVDKDFLNELSSSGVVNENDKVFMNYDSLDLYLPLISKYFENAKIVPILISQDAKQENLIRLKNVIKSKAVDNSLFVSTVSFSKDSDKVTKELDDISTFRSIRNFEFDNIQYLDVSAKDSLFMFLNLMDVFGYKTISEVENTILFFEGEGVKEKGASMLIFGNLFNDFEYSLIQDYKYDKNYNPKNDQSDFRLFRDIRGNKDSFLVGPDFLVFDGFNGECIKTERNDFKVSVCKFLQGDENAMSIISKEKSERDFVVTFLKFNEETLSDEMKNYAKSLAEAGSDIVVGKGISEILPAEQIKSSIIFYSLGDFLPDAKLFSELNSNLKGVVLAVNADEKNITSSIISVSVVAGYPEMSGNETRIEDFKKIISNMIIGGRKLDFDLKNAEITIPRK
ncbi:MAG: AmmeMemoRadiSam system protein B [Candidatus Gracilibacteria bacterium]|jgi:hypothetical protein|nr:AmmeMemoRadiSam system protein B [Candidatus Gracilibacteria bacterium]